MVKDLIWTRLMIVSNEWKKIFHDCIMYYYDKLVHYMVILTKCHFSWKPKKSALINYPLSLSLILFISGEFSRKASLFFPEAHLSLLGIHRPFSLLQSISNPLPFPHLPNALILPTLIIFPTNEGESVHFPTDHRLIHQPSPIQPIISLILTHRPASSLISSIFYSPS